MSDKEAKLVASIAATSPIAFESAAIENVSTPAEPEEDLASEEKIEDENPWKGVRVSSQENREDSIEPSPEEEPIDEPAPTSPEAQESELSDYSEAAIAARVLQESHPDLFNELDSNLDWRDFISNIDNYIAETLEAGKNYQLEEVGRAKEYVDFLLSGGDPETLKEALEHFDVTNLDLAEADEGDLEKIIRTEYEVLGAADDAEYVLESLKLKGKEALRARAGQSQKRLKEQELEMLREDEMRREQYRRQMQAQREKVNEEINSIIDGPEIMGYKLNDTLRQELKDMIFKPSVVVDVERDGKIVQQRVTEYVKLQQEFNKDIEQQVAFALLLKQGFDLSKIVAQGKKEKDSSLLEELKKRASKSSLPKVTSGYFS